MVNNLDDVPKAIDAKLLFIYIIYIFIFFCFIIFLNKKFKYFLNNKYIIFLSLLFLIWLLINGIIFPSIGGASDFWSQYSSNFRLRHILLFKLILCIILTIMILKAEIIRLNFIKFTFFYLIVSLCVNSFIFTKNFLIPNNDLSINSTLNKFEIGKNNLLVISFDGINGNVISDLMDEDNKKIFKDFYLYPNYTVSFPATLLSISSELTNINDLNIISNKDLIINKNKKNLNSIFTYGSYNKIFNGKNKIEEGFFYYDNAIFKSNAFLQTVLFPSVSRWATFIAYNALQKFRNTNVYNYLLKVLSFDFFKNNQLLVKDYYRISSLEVSQLFNKKNYVNTNTNNVYFFHFSFSHWHILFDKNCNYRPMLNQNKNTELQNFQGNVENTKCVLKKIKLIIKSLKENKLYDENTLIFKSDHGKPNGYHNIDLYNQGINNNLRWGIGRYNSFFMIKNINEKKENIKILKNNIGSSFLYNTYCEASPLELNCKEKDIDTVFVPINRDTFLNLNEFKEISLNNFNSLNF